MFITTAGGGIIAASVIGGMLGGGGGSSSGSTTSTSSAQPWAPLQPYIVGGINGTPGIANQAASIYGTTGMSQGQKNWNSQNQSTLTALGSNPVNIPSIWQNGALANGGGFDTHVTPASSVTPSQVNLQDARSAQGPLDPTQSMQQLLSGIPNNPYLDSMAQGLTGLSNQNLLQSVMPAIRSDAEMAGQYGGSRQGIAEGVAAGNAQTGLNNAIAGLYGNAYQQAQQNMYGTANNLNAQAGQNAQNNAGLNLQAQQFNSNLALQNNAQQIAQAQANLNNRVTGSNLINGGVNTQNNLSNALNSSYDYTRNQPWSDLAQYQSVIQPLAGMGNSQTQTNPYFTNPIGNALGFGAGGLALYNGMNNAGLLGNGGGVGDVSPSTVAAFGPQAYSPSSFMGQFGQG